MDTGGSRPITPGTAAPGTAELQLGILRQLQPSKSLAFIRSPQGNAEVQLGILRQLQPSESLAFIRSPRGIAELQLGILRQLQPSKSLAFIRSPQGIAELQLGFRPRARIGAFDAPSQFVRRIASQS
jgi:hypothetical protein